MKEIRIEVNMILAGDVGGTKTLLGLYNRSGSRPEPIAVQSFVTIDHQDLTHVVAAFANHERVRGTKVQAAAFGIAGPVLGQTATVTTVASRIGWGESTLAI